MTKIMFCTDEHIPFQDKDIIEIMFQFMRKFKPDVFILGGDTNDWYSASSFSKDPKRLLSLQAEFDETIKYLTRIRKTIPKSDIYMLESNHMDRMQKYLQLHPELEPLKCLKPENLLNLEKNNIKLLPRIIIEDTIFIHGEKLGSKSGATAAKNTEVYRMNGVNGHAHRANKYYYTSFSGTNFWIEAPCMCNKLDYTGRDPINWQNGFVWGYEIDGKVNLNIWTKEEPLILNGREIK